MYFQQILKMKKQLKEKTYGFNYTVCLPISHLEILEIAVSADFIWNRVNNIGAKSHLSNVELIDLSSYSRKKKSLRILFRDFNRLAAVF